jgi:iron-sulfur cluster repair protein YtfE (RIC family)
MCATLARRVEAAVTPTTIRQYFADDHDRLDGLFQRFTAKGDPTESHAAFWEFKAGLERHIGWEEDILFPLFDAHAGIRDTGPTAVMREEHQQIKRFLETIATKLRAGDSATTVAEAELLEVLEAHNWKEENILYPGIDQLVSTEERQGVFARMGLASAR